MTTVEVLRGARALLAVPGVWAKGDRTSNIGAVPVGCFCAETAIYNIGSNWLIQSRAREAVSQAIGCIMVYEWNDAPERTLEQVLAAFDKAIAFSESQP